jgi:hypothetical protein
MVTLTAWELDAPHGADEALDKVKKLHDDFIREVRNNARA